MPSGPCRPSTSPRRRARSSSVKLPSGFRQSAITVPIVETNCASCSRAWRTRVRSAFSLSAALTAAGRPSRARHTAPMWSSPTSPASTAAASSGSSGASDGPVRDRSWADPRRHPEPSIDLAGRQPQPGCQHVAHLDPGGQPCIIGPIDWRRDLTEHPVGQPAVEAVPGPPKRVGYLDPECIAGEVGTCRSQARVRGIDRVELRTNRGVYRLGGQRLGEAHEPTVFAHQFEQQSANAGLWMNPDLWITDSWSARC